MRAFIRLTYQDRDGDVQAAKALTFFERDGTTPLSTSIYAGPTGATLATLQTDANGEFLGYSDVPKRVWVTCQGVSKPDLFIADPGDRDLLVTDYGAVADASIDGTGTDNTTAIQSVINYLKTVGGGTVRFPRGNFSASELNCTATTTIEFVGEGWGATAIRPRTAGVNAVLDISGAFAFKSSGITIGGGDSGPIVKTLVLYGDPAAGQPGNGLDNASQFQSCRFSHRCSIASFYVYGAASCDMDDVDIYNYHNTGSGSAAALLMTGNNSGTAPLGAVSSSFTTLNTDAALPCSDWHLKSCEIHDFNTSTTSTALWLDGVSGFLHEGGNISQAQASGSKNHYVLLGKSNASCNDIDFINVKMYTDSGNVPTHGIYCGTAADTIQGLRVHSGAVQAAAALVGGTAITSITGFTWKARSTGAATQLIGFGGNNVTLNQHDCDAYGLDVNVGGGGTLGYGAPLVNPGTVTAGTVKCLINRSDGGHSVLAAPPAAPLANTLYRSSFAKASLQCDASGNLVTNATFNVTSVTKPGGAAGRFAITWETNFATSGYAVIATPLSDNPYYAHVVATGIAAGTCEVNVRDAAGALVDPNGLMVVAYGLQ